MSRAIEQGQASDGPNYGFFREHAITAFVLISDEDDCSALDSSFYDPQNPLYNDLRTRCSHNPEGLHVVSEYYDLLVQRFLCHGSPLILSGLFGVPIDGRWSADDPIEDLYALQQIDPECECLFPICENNPYWYVLPSPRIADLVMRFGDDGYLTSICNEDWEGAMMGIARKIQRYLL